LATLNEQYSKKITNVKLKKSQMEWWESVLLDFICGNSTTVIAMGVGSGGQGGRGPPGFSKMVQI